MQDMQGLSKKEAKKRLKDNGPNSLPSKSPTPDITIFFRQLTSPLIYILLIASGITFFLKDFTDTVVIMVAVVINAALGYYQERKAERALESLRSFLHPTATVLRGGLRLEISIEEIVPGDVVILAAGERVPADGELIEVHGLTINEAMLTGESVPVQKVITGRSNTANLVFMGTTVLSGRGLVKIQETGVNTQIGKIAVQLRDEKEEQTPLQLKLAKLAQFLAVAVVIIAVLIFVIGVSTGKDPLEMFTIGVAVAVAAIPEGLMVALTVILAIGMQRIFKRNALVRKLVAAETLGSVTIVASDKTGTLTEGKMTVSKTDFTDTKAAFSAMHYANNQEDPLEIAINEYLLHIKGKAFNMEKIDELPFDPDLKYQSALVKGANQNMLYVAGAPEIVLDLCNISNKEQDNWLKKIEEWGEQGLRIVGLACKTHSRNVNHIPGMGIESCQWLGLVGIEDPVRAGVVETIEAIHRSGVRLKIITGDYLPTTRAIWKNIKAESSYLQENYKLDLGVTGSEIESWGYQDWKEKLAKTTIFARVSPSQKLKIVEKLQEQGEVVAIFGDGVNDVLAIKRADIGIVVNEAADTAKETADMVLLDSNFKTVIAAIEEGRGIYDNIRKVALYLLSDSFSEIILIVLSLLLGVPLPLTAAQILWINLLTDGFPNLALTVEPKEKDVLKRKPEDPTRGLFNRQMWILTATISGVTGVTSFSIFWWIWNSTGDITLARSITFATLGVDSLLYVYSVRSLHQSILATSILSNKFLLVAVMGGIILQLVSLYVPFFNKLLHTIPLGLNEWGIVLGTGVLVIVLIEMIKWVYRR